MRQKKKKKEQKRKKKRNEGEGESDEVRAAFFLPFFFPPSLLLLLLLPFSSHARPFLSSSNTAQIGVNRVRARHPASPVAARRVIRSYATGEKTGKEQPEAHVRGSASGGSFFGRHDRLTLRRHATRTP